MPLEDLHDLLDPSIEEIVPLPPVIHIEPIHTCNLRCIMCHVSFQKMSKQRLDIDHLLRRLAGVEPGTVVLLGGAYEPSAHPDFAELVNGLTELGCAIDMTTNGTLFTDKLIDEVRGVNFRHISVSFDGIRKETYEFIRRRADWDIATRRIANFRNAFRDKPVQWQANYVVMQQNLDELIEAVDFWDDLGFHLIHFFLMAYRSDDPTLLSQSLEKKMDRVYSAFQELAEDVLAKRRDIRVRAQPFSFAPLRNRYGNGQVEAAGHAQIRYKHAFRMSHEPHPGMAVDCSAAHKQVSIWFDGRVALCNLTPIGNLYNSESLLQIYNNAAARNLRRGVKQNPKNCEHCDFFRSCVREVDYDEYDESVHHRNGTLLDQFPRIIESDNLTIYVKWLDDYYAVPKNHPKLPPELGAEDAVRFSNHAATGILSAASLEELRSKRDSIPFTEILRQESPESAPYLPEWIGCVDGGGLEHAFVTEQALQQLRKDGEGIRILEIGCGAGGSLINLSSALQNRRMAGSEVYCCDDWSKDIAHSGAVEERIAGQLQHAKKQDVLFEVFRHNAGFARRSGLGVNVQRGNLSQTLQAHSPGLFDLVYLDTGLLSDLSDSDLDRIGHLVKDGGLIAGHGPRKDEGAWTSSQGEDSESKLEEECFSTLLRTKSDRAGHWLLSKRSDAFQEIAMSKDLSLGPGQLPHADPRFPQGFDEIERIDSEPKISGTQRIYVYGTGQYGRKTREALRAVLGREIDGFIDSFKSGQLDGVPVYKRDDVLPVDTENTAIILASGKWQEIAADLRKDGHTDFLVNWSCDNFLLVKPQDPIDPALAAE